MSVLSRRLLALTGLAALKANGQIVTCRAPAPESLCFITTACLSVLGLPDDGWELRTLRRFRDEKLAHMPGGGDDIAQYYREAPRLNAWLMARPNAARMYAELYRRYIFPAACLARLGSERTARRFYTAMMLYLMDLAPAK